MTNAMLLRTFFLRSKKRVFYGRLLAFYFALYFFISPASAQADLAALRLAHFSPDAPLLDLLFDNKLYLRDLNFTQTSSYLLLPAGEHELKVIPHRAPYDAASDDASAKAPEPFIIAVTLEPGQYYTLVASGYFNPPPSENQLGILRLSMAEGTTATVTGPRSYGTTVTESSDLTNLFPGAYTVIAGQEGFETARYEAEVRAGDTTVLEITLQANAEGETSEPPPVVANQTTTNLEWRNVQLQLYNDELSAFPPPGSIFLRVIHASPLTPAVAVTLQRGDNDASEPLLSDLSYPNDTSYLPVVAGRVTVRLQALETSKVLTELRDLELQAGTFYTFYIVGAQDDDFVSVIPSIDAVLARRP